VICHTRLAAGPRSRNKDECHTRVSVSRELCEGDADWSVICSVGPFHLSSNHAVGSIVILCLFTHVM